MLEKNRVNINGFLLTTAERKLVNDRTTFAMYSTLQKLIMGEQSAPLCMWRDIIKHLRRTFPKAVFSNNGITWCDTPDCYSRAFTSDSIVRIEFLRVLMMQVNIEIVNN